MAFSMAGGGGPSHPEINVTPLIDVLLVLIIVFLVVDSMSKQKGLAAQIPEQRKDQPNQPLTPESTIVIQLAEVVNNQPPALKINQESVGWIDLKDRLHDIFKLRSERVAFVRGDDAVDFQYVAEVIDIARNAGVDRVGLLTARRY